MAKRYKPKQSKAHKKFTALAMKTQSKNVMSKPMRGGYRI